EAAEQAIEEHVRNVAAFPLAIPLMAGPGAITATVLLAGQAAARPVWLAVLLGDIFVGRTYCAHVGRHRQRGAVAASRRDPSGAGRPVRRRRRARGLGRMITPAGTKIAMTPGKAGLQSPERRPQPTADLRTIP